MASLQNNDQYIGQLLVKEGVITTRELDRGLDEQKRDGNDFLCEILVRLGLASEERIFSILSLQIGVPFLSLKDIKIDPLVLGRLPGSFSLAFKCMPLRMVDDVFYISMVDPLNTQALGEIKGYLGGSKLKIFLSGEHDIREAIKKYYGI